mmetsp:Transcript_3860/g.11160  ORF Transcript_3860/g.11160 Transcript_3860/m.11160 type:complete len:185 (+) Transcript_3860:168-722(+)
MVEAIREACDAADDAVLDLHMCVDRPGRYVAAMAAATGSKGRFIFQWEAMGNLAEAVQLASDVTAAGMRCGVSINPETDSEAIHGLLETGLADMVDVLAVRPGFGGQTFQESALVKLRQLRHWRDGHASRSSVQLLVDGGVNAETAARASDAGADILVAGTFLFRHPQGLQRGVDDLLSASAHK